MALRGILQALLVVLLCFGLVSPVLSRVQLVPIPWKISASPETIYIRPPQCSASFTIYVTSDYKDKPISILIQPDPRNPYTPSGYLFDGTNRMPSRLPDWQSTVTPLFSSPWENPPNVPGVKYALKIYAFPVGTDPFEYNVFTTVYYVIENTGVKTCSTEVTTTYATVDMTAHTTAYTTHTWTYGTSTYDWWDWWEWWRWDWWVGWWPWTVGEFDFSLDATPVSQSMKAGQSASFTTAVKLISGVAQPVTLSLSGFPSGVTYSLSLTSADPTFTSALQVLSQASLSPGTYPLTIIGTGGGKTHSTIVNLVVAENKQPSSLSLSVTPLSLGVGEAVALGGALSPRLATTVELVYVRPDGFELVKHVTTSSAGVLSDAFKPDVPGSWLVKARWSGDADHYACESQTQSFSVEPPPEEPPSVWDQIMHILPTVALVGLIVIIVVLAVVLVRRRSTHRGQAATTVSARLCSKCGMTIPERSEFCTNCGEKLR